MSEEEQSSSDKSAASHGSSQGFTFTDYLEGAVILFIIGAVLWKWLG